jgi:biopolymer transport protein ExbB
VEPTSATATAVVTTVEHSNFITKAFAEGGVTMFFIAIIAFLVFFLIIERFMTLSKLVLNKEDFNDKVFGMILRGDIRQAITFCDSRPAPLTNTLKSGLVQVLNKRPDEEVQVAMDGAVLRETPRLEGWTAFLAVFGNVATLVGLLGTIIGLIISFGGVAAADPAQKSEELSKGIAHALNCTAFGLVVAIPALVAYGYFQVKISRAINDMVESSMTLLNLVVANRDKIKD